MRKLVIVQRFLIDLIPVLTDFPQKRPQFAGQLAMEFGCGGKPLRYKFRRRSWRKLALRILFRREYLHQKARQRSVQCGERRCRFAVAARTLDDMNSRSHGRGASSDGG